MEKASMTRAALGQVASLGDIYDARTDNFCGISLFKRKIPDAALTLTDNHFSDIHLSHSDTFTEKFHKLDVKAELQVSVLAGLFSLSGAGRYLKDEKESARTVKSNLLYNIKTKDEAVNIYHEDLKEAFAIDAIEAGVGTHIVVGISWGANSVMSCQHKNTENRDVKEIAGNLAAQLKAMAFNISGKGEADYKDGGSSTNIDFEIRIFGDVLPRDKELPTTFQGALDLMKQVPDLLAHSNEGRGKPLSYRLIPISMLKDYLSFEVNVDSLVKSLEEETLVRIVQLFENISEAHQILNDFYSDTVQYKYCVDPVDMRKIIKVKEEFVLQETKFRSNLADMLSSVRSGKADMSDLEDLINGYREGEFSPDKLSVLFTSWGYITEKTSFARTLVANGAEYIGFESSLDDKIIKDFDAKIYVLYFTHDSKTQDVDLWKKNRQLFIQEIKKSSGSDKYYAVDCDIHPKLWPIEGMCIQIVQNGRVIADNMLEEVESNSSLSYAKCTLGMQRIVTKPNNRANLSIPCTGRNCNPEPEHEWMCIKCKGTIEYGFDEYFYCLCGRGLKSGYEFKCTDPAHGVAYEKHDDKYFEDLLSLMRPFKEINILILGETGVGKSTWINGFVNYLTNENLSDAEKDDLVTLIPSEFTVCDDNFEEITVSTGTDQNEVQNAGQSATQECKVYPFVLGDRKIRLIDTPGIGDTRGVKQDKENFQNILQTISYLDEIHGICILLKPNNARLTVMFRFCIKELLTYLHRDASHNIMFCFTNARGTFYRPGDTMPALKNLLKENKDVEIVISQHTVYCYDSEAYRFLAAVKNSTRPIKFADDERANFANSWEKSFTETKRMLKHITSLRPHPIKNTLNLNNAREVVLKLTKPLATISKTITMTKEVIENEMENLLKTKADYAELEKQLKTTRPGLKIIQLKYPRTVCANVSCKKIYGTGPDVKIKYVTICHDNCGLRGLTCDTIGDQQLLGCSAMNQGWCVQCKHSYREHMHIYFDTEDINVEVEDENVKALMNKTTSASDLKQKMVAAKTKEVEEYDWELLEIQKASVQFACFLKLNAITPYNDAMIDYMNHLIMDEEVKSKISGSDKTLKSMQSARDSYEAQIALLSAEMDRSEGDGGSVKVNVLNPEEVDKLVTRLKNLKHNGKTLHEALTAVDGTKQKQAVYREYIAPPKPSKPKSKKKWYEFWRN